MSASESPIIFDIETAPLPLDELKAVMPEFEPPKNLKDPAKIAAAIDKKREEFIDRAALSATTGRVVAIGRWCDGLYESAILDPDDDELTERDILAWFWTNADPRQPLIGFNSNRFDLPFLMRRSWALGVRVPDRLDRRGGFSGGYHVDLMQVWQCGDNRESISLDAACQFFGCGKKNGDGKFFHQVLRDDPKQAEAYLKNDVRMTLELAKCLGVLSQKVEFEPAELAY